MKIKMMDAFLRRRGNNTILCLIYDDQDDGRILNVVRKQQYILLPDPIAFLNDELKVELGMKSTEEEKEDYAKF
jgi:hypothetical protein